MNILQKPDIGNQEGEEGELREALGQVAPLNQEVAFVLDVVELLGILPDDEKLVDQVILGDSKIIVGSVVEGPQDVIYEIN